MSRKEENDSIDSLKITPIKRNGETGKDSKLSKEEKFIEIDFVGNNFIGIGSGKDTYSKAIYKRIVSIDKFYNLEGVSISSFFEERGKEEIGSDADDTCTDYLLISTHFALFFQVLHAREETRSHIFRTVTITAKP